MLKIWHKRWFLKQRQFKRKMHGGRLHAILGRHVFHRKVWRSDKRAIAGGLAVGLFMAFAPTIPFQMLLAAVVSIYFKVNLPLALVACWATNPLTIVPIYMAARELGKALLTHNEHVDTFVNLFVPAGQFGPVIRGSIDLTSGLLIFATLAAAAGYLAIQVLWFIMARLAAVRKRKRLGKAESRKSKVEVLPTSNTQHPTDTD
jgi:uncharacterized protein (DUF2062 family)